MVAPQTLLHLPIYEAMLALLVYGSSPQLAQVVDAVPSLAHRSRPWTLPEAS